MQESRELCRSALGLPKAAGTTETAPSLLPCRHHQSGPIPKLDALAIRQATDHGDQNVHMAFALAGGPDGSHCIRL
jgi:hypothetical protein